MKNTKLFCVRFIPSVRNLISKTSKPKVSKGSLIYQESELVTFLDISWWLLPEIQSSLLEVLKSSLSSFSVKIALILLPFLQK